MYTVSKERAFSLIRNGREEKGDQKKKKRKRQKTETRDTKTKNDTHTHART